MANKGVTLKSYEHLLERSDILFAFSIIGILIVMIISAPPLILDFLLAGSITSGLIVLLVVIYIKSPLSFSVFPSLLLVITLFRLSLNVATTRNILLFGSEGTDAAGKVIESFGQYVVGGNYIVGIVIFAILVIINFQVITKGATRVSEVAARFTLDAMPGKQMSIDADLNAGAITEEEAKARRTKLEDEASFYGSMDGALKFVRGDAIAGIIITIVNIVAGFAIGVLMNKMTLVEASYTYTILTIGDGLVSQLPALLISTASGLAVTRTVSRSNLGQETVEQLLVNPRAIAICALFLFLLSLAPGMPTTAFLGIGTAMGALAYFIYHVKLESNQFQMEIDKSKLESINQERVETLAPLDLMELEIGYELIPLVDKNQNGELLDRIKAVRRQFALELGIVIPPVHIKDNLSLKSNEYQILIKGVEVSKNEILMNHFLAIEITKVKEEIKGVKTTDPAFKMPAIWIDSKDRHRAKSLGYQVVDPTVVITTHIKEIIRQNSDELLGRDETQNILESLQESSPKLVEELVPNIMTVANIQKILKNLLREKISIRDIRTILETLIEFAPKSKDSDILTEHVRSRLARQISKQFSSDGILRTMTFSPELEDEIVNSVKVTEQGAFISIGPDKAQLIIDEILSKKGLFENLDLPMVLLTGGSIRSHISKLLCRFIDDLVVLSHNELTKELGIEYLAVIKGSV
ncbi:MAG: flagellar biosynthesis protein FlhA [Nitrospinota bacterium]